MSQAAATRPPFLEFRDARFSLWPVLLAAAIMQVVLVPAREVARFIFKAGPDAWREHVGLFVFSATMLQGLVALGGILVMRRLLPRADANLRWPPGRTYILPAAGIGLVMGLVMLVADYWPQLLAGQAPEGYSLDPPIAAGWLLAMATTGLGEETLFRGLLVGMVAALSPGRVRLGGFEISLAGVLVALMFGIAHYDSFLHQPLHLAIAQQTYAFVWGVTYVWLMERSRSLVAPIVAHGIGNFTEVACVMGLMVAWG